MKIGVDIRVLMDKNYSGVSEYTHNLLKEILRQDKENEYKLFYNSFQDLSSRLDRWNTDNSKLIVTKYPNKLFNYLLQKVFCYPKIDKLLGNVDLFWSPHFNFTRLSSSTKKVITVHDLSFLRYPQFFSARKNFWHKALRVKKIMNQADSIITVSENTKNDIIELIGVPAEKIRVIYSGNNTIKREVDSLTKEEFLKKNNINNPFILYLGNIEPRKNISGLIKAYNQLRSEGIDLKLVLAGSPGWKNKKIINDWKKSPYKKDIKFLGYINQEEKEILYSAANIFIYPSFYEGFGFPPLEAMTYGCPVICSNTSSLPEVVGSAALTINPFKPREIVEAIRIINKDKDIREKLITKGYQQAKLFTWERTTQEYLKLFKQLRDGKDKR